MWMRDQVTASDGAEGSPFSRSARTPPCSTLSRLNCLRRASPVPVLPRTYAPLSETNPSWAARHRGRHRTQRRPPGSSPHHLLLKPSSDPTFPCTICKPQGMRATRACFMPIDRAQERWAGFGATMRAIHRKMNTTLLLFTSAVLVSSPAVRPPPAPPKTPDEKTSDWSSQHDRHNRHFAVVHLPAG